MKAQLAIESDIASVKGLIAQKAIESWKKFPPKMKAQIAIEDMIEDGVIKVVKLLQSGRHDPKKGKLTTIVWSTLDKYYKKCAEVLYAQKRFDGLDVYLEDLKANGFDAASENENTSHTWRTFLLVYNSASDQLRDAMQKWFLQISDTKIHVTSAKFQQDKKEFRRLADKYRLDINDCRMVIHSSRVRNEVISRLPEYKYIELR
jgi:hypothetical protein